jgi:hypothetical protein
MGEAKMSERPTRCNPARNSATGEAVLRMKLVTRSGMA